MNIATALNRKYLEYTVVMLCSLYENNNEHIDAYLLHSELTTQDIDIIKNSLSKYDITIISVEINKSDFDDRLPRNTQWSIETYYRLMLMDILPESVDRLMYLDVDLIINGSIEEFYHIDFAGDDVIAADDSNGKRTLDTSVQSKLKCSTICSPKVFAILTQVLCFLMLLRSEKQIISILIWKP